MICKIERHQSFLGKAYRHLQVVQELGPSVLVGGVEQHGQLVTEVGHIVS